MNRELEAAKLERYAPIERTNVHPVVKELFLCEMKNVSHKNMMRYSDPVKEFCSSLYKVNYCEFIEIIFMITWPSSYKDFLLGFTVSLSYSHCTIKFS